VSALLLSAVALAASAFGGNLVLTMAALIVASMSGFAAFGLFWTLPAALLTGAAAAGGLALINSIGPTKKKSKIQSTLRGQLGKPCSTKSCTGPIKSIHKQAISYLYVRSAATA
jgi:hypothetical protein